MRSKQQKGCHNVVGAVTAGSTSIRAGLLQGGHAEDAIHGSRPHQTCTNHGCSPPFREALCLVGRSFITPIASSGIGVSYTADTVATTLQGAG